MSKDNDTTFSLMFELGRLIRSRMRAHTSPTLPQLEALHFVGNGKCTMHALAKHLKIAAPSATSLVDDLVRDRLVARTAADDDRRKVEISLTRRGESALRTSVARRKKVLSQLLARLSASDRTHLDQLLKKIIATDI